MSELGYLGLGSNVGDRRANLQAAVELLWGHGVTVLAASSVSTRTHALKNARWSVISPTGSVS